MRGFFFFVTATITEEEYIQRIIIIYKKNREWSGFHACLNWDAHSTKQHMLCDVTLILLIIIFFRVLIITSKVYVRHTRI